LLATLAVGCHAQLNEAQVNRRIEVQVRSQFSVPPDYVVTIGARTKSDFPGYDNLPVVFSRDGKQKTINFLLSTDGNTLARLEKFDISRNPSSAASIANRPIRGNPTAKITIVNFDDLECPYCARMHSELFPGIPDRYKDNVRIIYKDYPLVEIHPWAMHAAIDANCLADQSSTAYWNYVDYIHAHGEEVSGGKNEVAKSLDTLDRLAREEGKRNTVDEARLAACLVKQDETTVRSSMREGENLNVDGTPTMFINGERLSGALPVEQVWMAVDRALLAAGIQPPSASAVKSESAVPSQKQKPDPAAASTTVK
jgi:protein-disulfide isomerase